MKNLLKISVIALFSFSASVQAGPSDWFSDGWNNATSSGGCALQSGIGAAAGAALGRQTGGGSGKDWMTALGAVAGGLIASNVDAGGCARPKQQQVQQPQQQASQQQRAANGAITREQVCVGSGGATYVNVGRNASPAVVQDLDRIIRIEYGQGRRNMHIAAYATDYYNMLEANRRVSLDHAQDLSDKLYKSLGGLRLAANGQGAFTETDGNCSYGGKDVILVLK